MLEFLDTIPGTISAVISNPQHMAKNKAFQTALGRVTRKTHAAFLGG
jgi:hypothetical protein